MARNSSEDEITNVNFLRQHRTRTTKCSGLAHKLNAATGRRPSSQDIGISQCLGLL